MSAENFDGDGLADQPSVVYSFDSENGEQIRELVRSGHGDAGASPGDVLQKNTTVSDPTDSPPQLDLPGQGGLYRDSCGDDIPAFACLGHDSDDSDGCGKPVYVGNTCANPTCSRDWAAAAKRKTCRAAGKLEGLRRKLYVSYDGSKNIDFNHVVASPPDGFGVDSETPLKRTLLIIKTLLEQNWHIEGFLAIYHPYRIKKEYRKDQYQHGGDSGEGDMTWKDVLNKDDPHQFLKFEPHFHLFFPAIRKSFDYSVTEAVENQSGWLFHRITKGGEDNNISVNDLDDLVHQLTYCFSHAGVREVGPRDELASRMKGDLHNCYIPDGVGDDVMARFCDAAPKLLGVTFSNMNEATCSAEISQDGISSESSGSSSSSDLPLSDSESDCNCETGDQEKHPLHDVWNPGEDTTLSPSSAGGDPWPGDEFDAGSGSDSWSRSNGGSSSAAPKTNETQAVSDVAESSENQSTGDEGESSDDSVTSPVDDRGECGGTLRPMHEAQSRLEDDEWSQQAEFISGLRDAYDEYSNLDVESEQEKPWVDSDIEDDGDLDDLDSVIRTG